MLWLISPLWKFEFFVEAHFLTNASANVPIFIFGLGFRNSFFEPASQPAGPANQPASQSAGQPASQPATLQKRHDFFNKVITNPSLFAQIQLGSILTYSQVDFQEHSKVPECELLVGFSAGIIQIGWLNRAKCRCDWCKGMSCWPTFWNRAP